MLVISYNHRRVYINISGAKKAVKTAVLYAVNALVLAIGFCGFLFLFGTVGALENGGLRISSALVQMLHGCLMVGGAYMFRRGF